MSHPWLKDYDHLTSVVQPRGVMGPGNDTPSSAVTSGSSVNCGDSSATSASTASTASTLVSSPADSLNAEREKEAIDAFAGNLGLCLINTAHIPFEIAALQTPNSPGCDENLLDGSQHSPECAIASPMTVVDSSPASTNIPTPPLTDHNKAYCPLCSTPFSGTRQHRESNRRRHLKDVHQQGNKLCCTLCGWECGRTDSLRKHRQSVHGIHDPRVRPSSSSKRERISANRKA